MAAEVKLFSDAIDALEKAARALASLKGIPTRQRERYEDAVRTTYKLLDSAVNLVDLRLGNLALIEFERVPKKEKQERFALELARLGNFEDWKNMYRDVQLCSNLRSVHSEMDGLVARAFAGASRRDWNNARRLVDEVLEREGELAQFVASSLKKLSRRARPVLASREEYTKALQALEATRRALQKERDRLIGSELDFASSLSLRAR